MVDALSLIQGPVTTPQLKSMQPSDLIYSTAAIAESSAGYGPATELSESNGTAGDVVNGQTIVSGDVLLTYVAPAADPISISLDADWGGTFEAYTPDLSLLPTDATCQINWGDGTAVSMFNYTGSGSIPSHQYSTWEGSFNVGITAYENGDLIYAPPVLQVAMVHAEGEASPNLPAPYETNAGGASITGGDVFDPPITTNVIDPAGTPPAIDQCTTTAQPDDVVALTLQNYTHGSTTFWVSGQTTSGNATLVQAAVVTDSTNDPQSGNTGTGATAATAVSVQLPASLPANSIYFIWAGNGSAFSAPFIINQPLLTWDSATNAPAGQPVDSDYFGASYNSEAPTNELPDPFTYPGDKVSLFGQNLSEDLDQNGADDQSWVYLFPACASNGDLTSSTPTVVPVENSAVFEGTYGYSSDITSTALPISLDVNPYKVDFIVPASLPAGAYDVEVYNGHGGQYSISNWVQIDVSSNVPTQLSAPGYSASGGVITVSADADDMISAADVNTAISDAHTDWINAGGAGSSVADSWVTVELSAGTLVLTGDEDIRMESNVHLLGSGDTGSGSSDTVIEGSGASVRDLINLSKIDDTVDAAVSINNMYLFAGTTLINNAVIYDGGDPEDDGNSLDQLTIDDVTIDGLNGPDDSATVAAWDVNLAGITSHTQFLNSTFKGQGIEVGGGFDMLVDNCDFYSCGEQANTSMAIDVHETAQSVCLTNCTDQSLFDDITSPGRNIDFDSGTRFMDVQGTRGLVYAGDNTTIDLCEYPNAEPDHDGNGGEQLLNEGTFNFQYLGGEGAADGLDGDTVTGFTSDSVLLSGPDISALLGGSFTSIMVTSGPGMGESRTIVRISDGDEGILSEPWNVEPSSDSTVAIGWYCDGDTAYDNTLSGDGALSMLSQPQGVVFGGLNTAIVGNDISNLPMGITLTYYGYFDLIADNSIHNVARAIETSGSVDGANPIAWVVGECFRGNMLAGTADQLYENNDMNECIGFSIAGDYGSTSTDSGLVLMTVFDQNVVTGFDIGAALLNQDHGTSGQAGIVDTVFSNNLFSSDGRTNSVGLTLFFADYGATNSDMHAFVLVPDSNIWENFAGILQY